MLKSRLIVASEDKLEEQLDHFLRVEGIGVELSLVSVEHDTVLGEWGTVHSVLIVHEVPEEGA